MFRCLVACLGLFMLAGGVAGQSVLYPVRVGHKWGFATLHPTRGPTIKIEPRYDALNEEPVPWNLFGRRDSASWFLLFEADEQVGLLDLSFAERLPNRYQRIRPLTELYFAVEAPGDSLFTVIDTSGRRVLDGRYDDICPLDPSPSGEVQYFLVQQGQNWGIHQKNGPLLMPPKYAAIEVAYSTDFFKVRHEEKDRSWQLVNRDGKPVLPKPVLDAAVLRPGLIVEKCVGKIIRLPNKTDTTFFYKLYQNSQVYPKNWGSFIPLNKHLAALYSSADSGRMSLVHIATQEILKTNYYRVFRMDERYVLAQTVGSRAFQVLDSTGTAIPGLEADSIRDAGVPGLFFVCTTGASRRLPECLGNPENISEPGYPNAYFKKNAPVTNTNIPQREGQPTFSNAYWGVAHLRPGRPVEQVVENQYFQIFPFQDNLAICVDSLGFGVINTRFKEVVPCIYESIERDDDNVIWAYGKKGKIKYPFDENGEELKGASVYKNLKGIGSAPPPLKPAPLRDPAVAAPRFGIIPALAEVTGKQSAWKQNFFRRQWVHIPYSIAYYYTNTWKQQIQKGRWALQPNADFSANFSHNVVDVLATESGSWQSVSAVYYRNAPASHPVRPSEAFARMAFFGFEAGRLITPPNMVGFRPFQSGLPYTTFLDTEGSMGLIDRNGRQASDDSGRPLRFAYIGPFRLGRARVCVGGQLRVDNQGENGVYKITDQNSFFAEFHLRSPIWQQDLSLVTPKDLYVAGTNGDVPRWGFIDTAGRFVIEPHYELVHDYHPYDGLALFAQKNKKGKADFGAIDLRDSVFFKPDYTQIIRHENYYRLEVDSTPVFYFSPQGRQIISNPTVPKGFSEGRCALRGPGDAWGYIDTSGQIAIPYLYDTVRAFSGSRAAVVDTSGFWVFIDHQGNVVFQTSLSKRNGKDLGNFQGNRCRFRLGKGQCGFYDPQGNAAIPADNLWTSDFNRGAALVIRLDSTKQRTVAVVDTAGNYRLLPQFEPDPGNADQYVFNKEGIALVRIRKSERWVCINTAGKTITPEYDIIRPFVNSYARVKKGGKWGLVNAAGRECLPLLYNAIDETVSEGLVAVKLSYSDDWFFVDTLNKPTFKGKFKTVEHFQYGVAVVNETEIIRRDGTPLRIPGRKPMFFAEGIFGIRNPDKTAYYASAEGHNLFLQEYSDITPFYRGIAQVKLRSNERFGVLNRRGMFVLAPKYKNVHLQPDGNFAVNAQRFYGIANMQGKIILPPEYDKIEQLRKGYFRVEQGEKVGYIDKDGNWLFELQQ